MTPNGTLSGRSLHKSQIKNFPAQKTVFPFFRYLSPLLLRVLENLKYAKRLVKLTTDMQFYLCVFFLENVCIFVGGRNFKVAQWKIELQIFWDGKGLIVGGR